MENNNNLYLKYMINKTSESSYQNDIYRSKYYKYKNKYLDLKNIIGGSTYILPHLRTQEQKEEAAVLKKKKDNKSLPPLVRKEIPGEITEYEKNTIYEFKGIISCVGLTITGINEDEKYGLGIHIDNSNYGHFVHGVFTEEGESMKNNILEKINSWPPDTNLEIKFYKVPFNSIKFHSNTFHSDTTQIINQLKTLFNQHYQARINKCEEIISDSSCFKVEF